MLLFISDAIAFNFLVELLVHTWSSKMAIPQKPELCVMQPPPTYFFATSLVQYELRGTE